MRHLRAHTPIPADVLLRHRSLRYCAVDEAIDAIYTEAREKAKRLYPVRDRLAFAIRSALVLSRQTRRAFPDVAVAIKDDRNPRLRGCKTVISTTGEVRILPPRRTTKLEVKRKVVA